MLDRTEYRLEVHRDERDAFGPQHPHPGIPETAIAEEAVDQHDAMASAATVGEEVGFGSDRKGWRQRNTRGAVTISPRQARHNSANVAAGPASPRCTT